MKKFPEYSITWSCPCPTYSMGLVVLWRSTCHKQRQDVQHGAGGIMAQHLSQATSRCTAWGWWHYGAAPVTSNVKMYSMGLVVLWRSTCHKQRQDVQHGAGGIMAQHLSQATSRCTAWGWWYYGATPVTSNVKMYSMGLVVLWRNTCHKQRHRAFGIMAQHLSQAPS